MLFAWNYCPECGQALTPKEDGDKISPHCDNCERFYYHNPIPVTTCIVVNSNNEILLTRRAVEPRIGEWCLPGGFMELKETPEKCATRELKEETGLKAKEDEIELLGICAHPSRSLGSVLVISYLVRKWEGSITPGSDVAEAKFFSLNNMPQLAFDLHKDILKSYIERITSPY